MREYEVVYILKGNCEGEPAEKIQEKVKSFIDRYQGTIIGFQALGKKSLAYRIEKETRGNYYWVRFVSEGGVIAEMERFFKLSEDVIRFLTVKLMDDADPEERKVAFEKSLIKAREFNKGESDETQSENRS